MNALPQQLPNAKETPKKKHSHKKPETELPNAKETPKEKDSHKKPETELLPKAKTQFGDVALNQYFPVG